MSFDLKRQRGTTTTQSSTDILLDDSMSAVSSVRLFLKYWLPVLIWMAIIFSASGDTMSFQHSSRILAPLIRWFFPQISEKVLFDIIYVVRKCAHLTEYAILALLVWRARRKPVRQDRRPWSGADARFAVIVVALYAATDEFHQLFVPHREGKIGDVIIDTTGGVAGILVLWAAGRFFKHW